MKIKIPPFETSKLGLALVAVVLTVSSVQAATIAAANTSLASIQSAVNSASSGDIVTVPAGTSTWSGALDIPAGKRIQIVGAGTNSTIINNPDLFLSTSGARISGFRFVLASPGVILEVDGTGWRIDHCRFEAPDFSDGVMVRGNSGFHPYGLIDHCDVINCRVLVIGDANLLAHKIWSQPLNMGSDEAVYVEDCSFTYTVHGNAIDTNYGGKYVFRNNVVVDNYVEVHSVQGNHRTSRKWEIYNNQFIQRNRAMWCPLFVRGGTGVIFGNRLSGAWTEPGVALDNVRSCEDRGDPPGVADGGALWDGNQPISPGGTGTHTGAAGATVLTDSTKSWPAGSLVGIYVYNTTDGSKGKISANTATTITATLAGGTQNRWNNGNAYKVTDGYPARDQIGRSTDAWLWTTSNPYPPQAYEPAYGWDNKYGSVDFLYFNHNCEMSARHIQPGRDYYNNTIKPGYTPLAYPHPLIQSWGGNPPSKPTAPQGVTVSAAN